MVNGTKQTLTQAAAEALEEAITPLLSQHDPRAMVQGLLIQAVSIARMVLQAKRWTHADVAVEFSQAMCATLEAQPEKPRIQLVDATGALQ